MKPEKEALSECGRILKKVAPILGITVDELENRFSVEISKITGTKIGKERIHKLFCGEPWPTQYYGLLESYSAVENIARSILDDDNLSVKIEEIKLVVYTAFADYEYLTYFYSDYENPNTHINNVDVVERIMDDLSRFPNDEFMYILDKYLKAFLSISTLELDILSLGIELDLDCKIPVSIRSGLKLLDDPVLQQWLELRNNNHRDAFRKVNKSQLEKIRNRLKKRLGEVGLSRLIPLTCFIEDFVLEKKQGIWPNVTKEDLDKILICKYIIGTNDQYLNALKLEVLDEKLKQAMTVSNGIVSIDLAKYSGVMWVDIQL